MKASIDAKKMIYEYFQNLCADAALCSQLSELATIEELPANTCILEEGERPDCICLVLSGELIRKVILQGDVRTHSFLAMEAKERYLHLVQECPDLVLRVNVPLDLERSCVKY